MNWRRALSWCSLNGANTGSSGRRRSSPSRGLTRKNSSVRVGLPRDPLMPTESAAPIGSDALEARDAFRLHPPFSRSASMASAAS